MDDVVWGGWVDGIISWLIDTFITLPHLVLLILISFALSIPAVWFLMSDWLQDFVYRYKMGSLIFLWTILLILLPTAITVSYQSYKAATSNPADTMHEE